MAGGAFIILARVIQVTLFGSTPLSAQAASDEFVVALGLPGLLGTLGFILGLVGLYARQAQRAGLFGFFSFVFAFIGTTLTFGANWTYAFASPFIESAYPGLLDISFSDPAWGQLGAGLGISYIWGGIGSILIGISLITAKVFPRWVGMVLVAGTLAAGLAPLETHGPSGIIVNTFIASGPIAFGYALWADLPGRMNGPKPEAG